jgi:hypothetical protein
MKNRIKDFWQHFLDHLADLESMRSADDPAYDELVGMLQRIDEGLYIQFSNQPETSELIITAEGESGLFSLVERIVAEAPAVEGWKIFALKPKIGFPKSVRWESVTVSIGETIACPVFDRESGAMGLRLYASGVNPSNEEEIHSALLQAIDSGLGEKRFAMNIHFTNVYPLEELPEGVTSFPLSRLDDYLSWREAELRNVDQPGN